MIIKVNGKTYEVKRPRHLANNYFENVSSKPIAKAKVEQIFNMTNCMSIKALAQSKLQQNPDMDLDTATHKARWSVLLKSPISYNMYVDELSDYVISTAKFCTLYGIIFRCYHRLTDKMYEILPVRNLNKIPLFWELKNSEQLDTNITNKRSEYKAACWDEVEEAVMYLSKDHYVESLDYTFEKAMDAQQRNFKRVCYTWGIQPDNVTEAQLEYCLGVCRIYAPAYGLDVPFKASKATTDTEDAVTVWTRNLDQNDYDGTSYKEDNERDWGEMDPKPFYYKNKQKNKAKFDEYNKGEILETYMLILYYDREGIEWDAEYHECPECGAPIRISGARCPHCDHEHTVEEEPFGIMPEINTDDQFKPFLTPGSDYHISIMTKVRRVY